MKMSMLGGLTGLGKSARACRAFRALSVVLALFAVSACGGPEEQPAPPEEFDLAEPEQAPYEWPTLNGEPPLVIAHRGASGYLPEHTIEAYDRALNQGADAIEPDLVITKDGALIARHDRYLSTTTNVADLPEFADRKRADPDPNGDGRVDWWVEDFTLSEIKTLKARQPREGRSKEFDDQFDIPTFSEVLLLATVHAQEEGRPIAVYPETKNPSYFASIELDFETPLLLALEGFNAGQVFLQSFEPDILRRLHDKTPATAIVLLTSDPATVTGDALDEIAGFATGIGVAKPLVVDERGCARDLVAAAHQRGLFVHAWTFRDDSATAFEASGDPTCGGDGAPETAELNAHFRAGVDGVFSDFPDTAIAARDAFDG
ncbi:MAG: glycerophosphodiester phosphodiesterase family protein [Pseudomonadota bacterium]